MFFLKGVAARSLPQPRQTVTRQCRVGAAVSHFNIYEMYYVFFIESHKCQSKMSFEIDIQLSTIVTVTHFARFKWGEGSM